MVRIKTWRLTRNPQLGDPVAWLNLTLADRRELDDVAMHRSPGGRWFFQALSWLRWWGGRCTERPPRRTIACGTRRARSRRAPGECGIRGERDYEGLPGRAVG